MTEPESGLSVRTFFGWTLVVVGALWIAFAGVCTASVISDVTDTSQTGWVVVALIAGAISALIGWGILALGRALVRRPPAAP